MSSSVFASFDDASSTLSDREDFLLVLVSSLSGTSSQGRNQKRALTMIEACGVQPEVLDAADPANVLVRDELCDMSGIRGIYPQFFLVQGDKTSFFADFAELEHMNEEGTLAEWLSMELPIKKLSPQNNHANNKHKGTNEPVNDGLSHVSQSDLSNSYEKTYDSGIQCDNEYANSSTTEDLLNVESVSEILNSIDAAKTTHDEKFRRQDNSINMKRDRTSDNNQNMIVSVAKAPSVEDEWSNPFLHDQFEDEMIALEDLLEDGGSQAKQQDVAQNRYTTQKRDTQSENHLHGLGFDDLVSGAQTYSNLNQPSSVSYDMGKSVKKGEQIGMKNGVQYHYKDKGSSASSFSSTVTTPTVTPTLSSSSSRSPDRPIHFHGHGYSPIHSTPSPLPSPSVLSFNKNDSNGKETSVDITMETVSTRSETEQLLRAEIEELKQKCEKLTAERYIIEGQLKEVRERSNNDALHSKVPRNTEIVHKFQLQQTTRCAGCMKVFKSNPASLNVPIASQACGHSICRNCCHKRLSAVRRNRDEITMNDSERLRNTISNDLFMCGMGNMSEVYSPSFEEHQRQLHECEACPICGASKAFRQGKLPVNESLCIVLKLLDD